MRKLSGSKRFSTALTLLVLGCVCAGLLYLPQTRVSAAADEIYCPLQKTWVKKDVALTAKQREPLKDICAREDRKSLFLTELIESLHLAKVKPSNDAVTKAFFAYYSYFGGGKQALKNFTFSQNAPEPQYFSAVQKEKAAQNSGNESSEYAREIFVLHLRARPPTFQVSTDFPSQNTAELSKISRKIQPRAPPVSSYC